MYCDKGISDTPAWVVSKANQYARLTGKTPFVIYQGAWNVMERSFEREIIPMARSEGMLTLDYESLYSLQVHCPRNGPCTLECSCGW